MVSMYHKIEILSKFANPSVYFRIRDVVLLRNPSSDFFDYVFPAETKNSLDTNKFIQLAFNI